MRLEFGDWILSQKISGPAKDLFQEAITCYKASTYRASLLLSYLGFQTIARDRVLAAKKPSGITEKFWNNIINDLRNEDKWDSMVFETIQRKNPASIFKLSEDLRNQVVYWKNRRNDCAHSKSNTIGFSHVESFWQFVESNLAKFVVNGSKEGLLNDISIHFNPSLTSPDEDSSFIIEQIPNAVDDSELADFFEGVCQVFLNLTPIAFAKYQIDFFNDMFSIEKEPITSKLVEFLKTREPLLIKLLRAYPNRLLYFSDDEKFIRRLWYTVLFQHDINDFPVYCSLLRNGLILSAQIEEAHRRIIRRLADVVPGEECFCVLRDSDFFNIFKNIVFGPTSMSFISNFKWANFHLEIVMFYLDRIGIDEEVAQELNHTFSKKNHPYELKKRINRYLHNNEKKKKEWRDFFWDKKIDLPEHLNLQSREDVPDKAAENEMPF